MIVLQIMIGVCVVVLGFLGWEISAASRRRRSLREMADKESKARPRAARQLSGTRTEGGGEPH